MSAEERRLEPFERHPVVGVGIEIPSAGGGLHDALRLDPRELELAEECTVVMRLRCRRVRFQPADDKDPENLDVLRIHTMGVIDAAFIDDDVVAQALAAHRERVRRLADEESGQEALALPDPPLE